MTGLYHYNTFLNIHTSIHKHHRIHCDSLDMDMDMDMDLDHHNLVMDAPVLVNDPFAAPPLAPGVWDLEFSPQKLQLEQTEKLYDIPPMAFDGLSAASSAIPLPPTPRPASLTLRECDASCSPPANASPADDDEPIRGRSPGPSGLIPPPAPRLVSRELPGANPGPPPPMCGTRPRMGRGYSALGLDLSSTPSPVDTARDKRRRVSWEGTQTTLRAPPFDHRGRSDDFHDRVSSWSRSVAAATSHMTPVHTTSSRPWADDLGFALARPHRPMERSKSNRSIASSNVSQHADQLDPWAARIGRSRGRTVDMPTVSRSRLQSSF